MRAPVIATVLALAIALATAPARAVHQTQPASSDQQASDGRSTATARNATVIENERPGTADWEITRPALAREIEGYASATSVNGGEAIDIFASTQDPRYSVDVYRMGWYGGAGARRVAGPIERRGIA